MEGVPVEVLSVQTVLNIALSIAAFLGGWVLNTIWRAVNDLQRSDKELAEKVSSIEVLVAGQYVKRDDFDRNCERLFNKLDEINNKLDRKVDK
jgi:hypothetical protein